MAKRAKKQTRTDIHTPNRLIYELSQGAWENCSSKKADKKAKFCFVKREGNAVNTKPLGPLPDWVVKHNPPRVLTLADFKELCALPMNESGMIETLNRFGPWDVPGDTRGSLTVEFESWYWTALEIRRAYHLFNVLRRGECPQWEFVPPNSLRVTDWPTALRREQDPDALILCIFRLGLKTNPISGTDGEEFNRIANGGMFTPDPYDFHETEASRRFAKTLLAQYIHQGLKGVHLGCVFDREQNVFRTDVSEDVTVSLREGCWLILRDIVAGLSGIRFCEACKKPLPPTMNRHAKVCPKDISPGCQRAVSRRKKKAELNGAQEQ